MDHRSHATAAHRGRRRISPRPGRRGALGGLAGAGLALGLALAPPPVRATTPAPSTAPSAPADAALERATLETLDDTWRRSDRPPLPRDARLDLIAAKAAAAAPGADVRRLVRDTGAYEGLVLPVVLEAHAVPAEGHAAHASGLARYVRRHVLPHGVTHVGVAQVGQRVGIVFVRRLLELELPEGGLPRPMVDGLAGQLPLLRLRGRLAGRVGRPKAVIARPDGRIDTIHAARRPGELDLVVPLSAGDGEYLVEVLVHGERGAEVAALTRVQLGKTPPTLDTVRLRPNDGPPEGDAASDEGLAPAAQLLELIRRDRDRFGLPDVRWDPTLAATAQAHARAMAAEGVVAHVLPGGEPPGTRLARAGVTTVRFYENVALARSAQAAHEQLMASPSHREAVVDPLVTHVGLGAFRTEDGLLYVTEHLAVR